MSLKIKICGLRESENMQAIVDDRIDWFGFIFYSESKRFIGDFGHIAAEIPAEKRVGVFVNESVEVIKKMVKQHQLASIQLHGDEEPSFGKELKALNLSIIKAFAVDDNFDFSICDAWQGIADYLLFDTKGNARGGNGQTFNWQLLNQYTTKIPFLLSGGLSLENIHQALQIQYPYFSGLDLNSGLEDAPGLKNKLKVEQVLNYINPRQ
ncbi:MAG: phosphoribosylanthranilate isomerase [Cyclobacteriaceae bacterium]|jgi:phosphoribosylanthranilate isomerase|nr:phosphoribosylanthranilate isomerase [Cytophagales bacterium]MCZ8328798.1 phosphoribosylanthranilate isomerase [Cyclobacteriaceae bacterium]